MHERIMKPFLIVLAILLLAAAVLVCGCSTYQVPVSQSSQTPVQPTAQVMQQSAPDNYQYSGSVHADFNEYPDEGRAPLTVTFRDTSYGPITTWDWDFGDGARSTLQNPVHTYTAPGEYYVVLSVSGQGGTSIETEDIEVYR